MTYPPGSLLIRQGDEADKLFIVVQGECDVFLSHPDGGEIIVNHISPGEYFGEMALVRGGTRTASVRAWSESPVEVMTLDRKTFDNLAGDSRLLKDELERVIDQRLNLAQNVTSPNGASDA